MKTKTQNRPIETLRLAMGMALGLLALSGTGACDAWAAPPASAPGPDPEAIEIRKVSEKYWAQGDESELGVVQNRTYTRARRVGLDLFTGTLSTDPFLSVRTFGGTLGWNFDDHWGLHAVVWRAHASDSAAYESFRQQAPTADVDRNPPTGFHGLQVNRSVLYGKAALFGKTLMYVDVFLFGGAGLSATRTGNYLTPFVGIGQKIHLTRNLSLHLDYRVLRFSERLTGPSGTHERTNTSDSLNLGVGFLL